MLYKINPNWRNPNSSYSLTTRLFMDILLHLVGGTNFKVLSRTETRFK